MIIKDERHVKKEKVKGKTSPQLMILAVFILTSLSLGSLVLGVFSFTKITAKLDKWLFINGQMQGAQQIGLKSALKKAGKSYLANNKKISSEDTLPVLDLQIKFKHYHKLLQDRNEAIEKGLLATVEKHTVPAEVKYGDKKYKANIRLKGDMVDHILDKYWSYRIDIKKGERLFGMSRFSVQHPRARDFHSEKLIFDQLQANDILTTRYQYIRFFLNGEDYGVYALEEHFTKDLLESQKRKEAPIIKFDETLGWHGFPVDNWHGPQTAKVDYFSKKRIHENPVLKEQSANAVALMRGFVEGKLKVKQVFDMKKMADYMAILELWDVMHGFVWNNLRFYYNPYVAKLEPLAYDLTAISWKLPHSKYLNSLGGMHLFRQILKDDEFRALFFTRLKYHAQKMSDEKFYAELNQKEEKYLSILRRTYPLISPFDKNVLKKRVTWAKLVGEHNYLSLRKGGFIDFDKKEARFPAKAYLNRDNLLEIQNFTPYELKVNKLKFTSLHKNFELIINESIDAGELYGVVGKKYFDIKEVKLFGIDLGRVDVAINDKVFSIDIEKYQDPLNSSILQAQDVNQYKFLNFDHQKKTILIKAGTHKVDQTLVTPEGYRLTIEKGATLIFSKKANMIVKGSLTAIGSKESPITLKGIGQNTWPGIAIIAPQNQSLLKYVKVQNTSGVKLPGYFLTGGVNFYKANIECHYCSFENNVAEDALNIVHANFVLNHTRFYKTRSDAFDGDFSKGDVLNSTFKSVGGDAIDFSGSDITADNSRFDDVNDKAISVGEQSKFSGKNLFVSNSGTGIAVKDWSNAKITNSNFSKIKHVGVMAYMKKNLFGPAQIEAHNLTFESTPKRYLAQVKSSIVADGVNIDEEDIDIDSLYKHGHMKK